MSTRASLPQVVVLPVPFTPTTRTTAGRPSWHWSRRCDRSSCRPGRAARHAAATGPARACARRAPAPGSSAPRPARSSATTPMSAVSRVSSISSQSCSPMVSRDRTLSRPRPRVDLRAGQPRAQPDETAGGRLRHVEVGDLRKLSKAGFFRKFDGGYGPHMAVGRRRRTVAGSGTRGRRLGTAGPSLAPAARGGVDETGRDDDREQDDRQDGDQQRDGELLGQTAPFGKYVSPEANGTATARREGVRRKGARAAAG